MALRPTLNRVPSFHIISRTRFSNPALFIDRERDVHEMLDGEIVCFDSRVGRDLRADVWPCDPAFVVFDVLALGVGIADRLTFRVDQLRKSWR